MAAVTFAGVTKRYGKLVAVDRMDLEIGPAEFFVILGPAGAGKTTTLKMIAGIEDVSEGEIRIDGQRITGPGAPEPDAAMIFENYALYPHLTVFDNIAFPLRSRRRKASAAEIAARVEEIARTLEIEGLLERRPAELSGGQRQRVSLGRALVRKPKVFLMDEPLSHLDAKLRHQMRRELKKLKGRLESAVVFVTHDYMEALSLADRIAVLDKGRIHQVGTPEEVYTAPEDIFVASQLGYPRINLVEGRVLVRGDGLVFVSGDQALAFLVPAKLRSRLEQVGPGGITAGIRPAAIEMVTAEAPGAVRAVRLMTERLGNRHIQFVAVGGTSLAVTADRAVLPGADEGPFLSVRSDDVLYFGPSGQRIKEDQHG